MDVMDEKTLLGMSFNHPSQSNNQRRNFLINILPLGKSSHFPRAFASHVTVCDKTSLSRHCNVMSSLLFSNTELHLLYHGAGASIPP